MPTPTRLPEVNSIDDKTGKPVNIRLHIGEKPILASGNSDGHQQMLEYVTSGDGPSLGLIIHHDDAEREVAYDRRPRSASSTPPGTRRRRRAGSSSA